MEDINYKEQDRKAIVEYLTHADGEVEIPKLIAESGANKLRVYTLIYELWREGMVIINEETELGTPVRVSWKK